MNFLVLGGNGYLGSKVVRRLLNENHKIVCTKRILSNLSRVEGIDINWISSDVNEIETAMKYYHFDFVLNLACNYGGNGTNDDVWKTNLEFPLSILYKTVENKTKNFMTIGTGLPDYFNIYSFSKKLFSEFGRFYAKEYNINFYNMKLEMFYGADEPSDRFLSSIIHNMLKGEEVNTTLGTQKRDIIAVCDVVEAIIMVLNANIKGYHEISIGTGVAPTISDVIDYIWKETGTNSKLNKGAIPMRKNEPDCVADLTFLRSIGEWTPIDWKKGIHNMIFDIKKIIE